MYSKAKANNDIASGSFLCFALVAQEMITSVFALYSYSQGDMLLATFYLALASTLIVALGVFYIFDQQRLAKLLLTSTLICGFFFLLIIVQGIGSLMWCLSIVPVLVGIFAYRHSLLILILIFAITIWILGSDVIPMSEPHYESKLIAQFLSAFLIIAIFTLAMNRSGFDNVSTYQNLTSQIDEVSQLQLDALTKLPTRQSMERHLELKYQQYLLDKHVFSILLVDLDHFKFINDCYGHDVGDNILCITTEMLQRSLRDQDVIARWGGNEFMVLLHGATGGNAVRVGDRLRLNAKRLDVQTKGDALTFCLSLGVASIDKCTDVDDLISTAENGIYQAKHMGRDRVVIG